MKKLADRQALVVAFIVSGLSLSLTLGSVFVFRPVLSAKQSLLTARCNVDAEIVTQGRQIFVKHCAECHGWDARGDEGSDLHNLRARDPLIRQVITGGQRRNACVWKGS